MLWIILAVFAVAVIAGCILDATRKPYRVVRNGAGKFLLQAWQCTTPSWVSVEGPDPRKDYRTYKYVTIREFDTLEEATAEYRREMAAYLQSQADKRAQEAADFIVQQNKARDEEIVKVYRVSL